MQILETQGDLRAVPYRMNREKVAGENFRDGGMEVAFELWIEQI